MGNRKTKQVDNPSGNYKLSRLNAVRHGILSQHTLLPWEPEEEYGDLHRSLRQEYTPVGPTEEHLVEEIAGIIWRKRRLRQAEGSCLRTRFQDLIDTASSDILRESLFGEQVTFYKANNAVFTMPAAEAVQKTRMIQEALELLHKAKQILITEGSEKYHEVLETLPFRVQEWWEEVSATAEGSPKYEPTSEGLIKFLDREAFPFYSSQLIVLSHREDILSQVQGHSINSNTDKLERLARYEVFLDRKFERILSMLLKLQALRREKEEKVIE